MRSCILLIALSLYSVNAGALNSLFSFEDDYTGTAVLTFLKLPIGARSVAMGGNIAPIEEQAFALFTNPAAMALQSGVNTSISHTEMLGEFRHEVVAGSFAVPWNGRVGIGFNGLFTTPFTNSRSIEEEKSDFKAQDFAFSAGWATSLWHDRIQFGTRVNYLKSQIHTTIGQGYSFDWGLMNRLLWGFKSSVVLQNVSQGFSYGHVQEKLPTTMSLGLGWGDYTTPFSVTIGYSKSNDGLNYFNGGWEQHLGEYINLRLGIVSPCMIMNYLGIMA
jgi:hypothetical protein